MTRRARLLLFLPAAAGAAALMIWGLVGLPDFGHYTGEYGNLLTNLAVPRRAATSVIATTTFDFRGFDTLGEEFILFAAATGVAALLRAGRETSDVSAGGRRRESHAKGASDSTQVLVAALVGPAILFGIYIVIHGPLTPGGGFQGGVLLAAAGALAYLAGRKAGGRPVRAIEWLEGEEGLGAAGFTLIGFGGLVFAAAFLQNFLPAGDSGSLLSGGTIPLSNISVGIEVLGAFLLILSELLDQQFLSRRGKK
jgi:multicomponent Na+:H+ antiporter subunit B